MSSPWAGTSLTKGKLSFQKAVRGGFGARALFSSSAAFPGCLT